MGADLFESYVGSIIGAIGLAAVRVFGVTRNSTPGSIVMLPLLIAGRRHHRLDLGTFFGASRPKEGGNPPHAHIGGTFRWPLR